MKTNDIIIYPAVFSKENEYYNVVFPDVPEAITFGVGMVDAVQRSQEALGLAIYDKLEHPSATEISEIDVEENECIVMITLDLARYRREHDTKTVKKNTSIPAWLNEIAMKQHINFSQTLTEALKQKLKID